MRNLASIQKIKSLKPIEGADKIEVAEVLGWATVVKKGDFKVDELVVFCEVDSLLPIIPELEFLASRGTKKMLVDGVEREGYLLKTARLRGQISQGLCISPPATILTGDVELIEGADVTEALGVVKYERPIPASLSGVVRGMFPSSVPKTDETRVQAVPEVLERQKDVEFYVTEKVDGTSMTAVIIEGELHICSRNLDLLEDEKNTYWKVARQLDLEEKLKSKDGRYALQGEVIGEGINKNKLKIKGQICLFFNAYDMVERRYLNFEEFKNLLAELSLKIVPIIEKSYRLPKTVDELVEFATKKTVFVPDVWAEGIVLRAVEESRDVELGRLSFKIVNPLFLLKHGE